MKKMLLLFVISKMITSYNSPTDIDTLKFGYNVFTIIKDINDIEKTSDSNAKFKKSQMAYYFGKL